MAASLVMGGTNRPLKPRPRMTIRVYECVPGPGFKYRPNQLAKYGKTRTAGLDIWFLQWKPIVLLWHVVRRSKESHSHSDGHWSLPQNTESLARNYEPSNIGQQCSEVSSSTNLLCQGWSISPPDHAMEGSQFPIQRVMGLHVWCLDYRSGHYRWTIGRSHLKGISSSSPRLRCTMPRHQGSKFAAHESPHFPQFPRSISEPQRIFYGVYGMNSPMMHRLYVSSCFPSASCIVNQLITLHRIGSSSICPWWIEG